MSAYKRIECSLKDKDTLLKALGELGFEAVVSKTPQKLRGFMGDTRVAEAEIVVPKEQINRLFTSASNDMGFAYNTNTQTYEMIVSDYDVSRKINLRVVQAYAATAIRQAMEAQGFEVETVPNTASTASTSHRSSMQGTSVGRKECHTIQIVGGKLI